MGGMRRGIGNEGLRAGLGSRGGGAFTPAEAGTHTPPLVSVQTCVLLEEGEPGEAGLLSPLKQHLAQLTCTPGPAHMHTWLSSHTHLAQLTCTPGPAHMHTWPSSHLHLAQLTCTPGPAHIYTWLSSQAHLAQLTYTPEPVP